MANPGIPDGLPPDPGAPTPPAGQESLADKVHVFLTEEAPEALGHIFEGIHEVLASPEELAQEHMAEAQHLQMEGMQALMAGDVDGGSALIAQAGQEMQNAVGHLADPDHHDLSTTPSEEAGPLSNQPNIGLPGADGYHGFDHFDGGAG